MARRAPPKDAAPQIPKTARQLEKLIAQVAPASDATHRSREQAQERQANRIARAAAEIRFVELYVEAGFSHVEAYRRLRPGCSDRDAKRAGRRWITNRRVVQLLARVMGRRLDDVAARLTELVAALEDDMASNAFDYIGDATVNIPVKEGVVKVEGVGFLHEKSRYTLAQQRAVRSISFKDGAVSKFDLIDRQVAQKMYGEFLQVLHGITKSLGGTKTTGGALAERIAKAREMQIQQAKRLPPPKGVVELRPVPAQSPQTLIPGVKSGSGS